MKLHEEWILKAENDLKSSKRLVEGNEPILDTASYHTQQCIEKLLKGFLVFHNKPLIKTHDLIKLNDHCVEVDAEFEKLYDIIEQLNPYSVVFRYPGEFEEPEYEDVLDAIEYAEEIFIFVKEKIGYKKF